MKTIEFKGMNRSTSPQNNEDGNCEEIINLRHENGAWRSVGTKKKILQDVGYEQVFTHDYMTTHNYIGFIDNKVVWFDPTTKEQKQVICTTSGQISIQQLNNILLVKDENNIHKATFANDKYQATQSYLPDIPIIEKKIYNAAIGDRYIQIAYNSKDEMSLKTAGETILSFINKNKKEIGIEEGYILLCTTFELFDGSETKPSPPILIELGSYDKNVVYTKVEVPSGENINITAFFKGDAFGFGYIKIKEPLNESYRGIIKKINIYTSNLISHYDPSSINVRCVGLLGGVGLPVMYQGKLDNDTFSSVLLFKIHSVDPFITQELKSIKFDDSLTTNPTMPVDSSGWLETTGDVFVYNKRLHLYNLQRNFSNIDGIVKPWFTYPNGTTANAIIAIYINTGDQTIILTSTCDIEALVDSENIGIFMNKFIAFPDSRAIKIEIYVPTQDSWDKPCILAQIINLSPSKSYNFAFAMIEVAPSKYITQEPPKGKNGFNDTNNIIVSGIANPYAFPPEHSYTTPGEILNMAVATEQISDTQIGQYPLYVFTTEGIYALQVGDGKILYSNMIPISTEILTGNLVQTRYGIVFSTRDGIKLIRGREIINLSEPLDGNIDTNIRACNSFKIATNHQQLYNIQQHLCDSKFNEYLSNANIGYNTSEDELIISNASRAYSYVYSFKSKVWYKISEVFSSFNRYLALKKNNTTSDLCDIREETETNLPAHLQTRPLVVDSYNFKVLYRMILRGELKPAGKYFGAYIFASNNLKDWIAVSGKQFNQYTPHVTLERIQKSFRYFIIVAGGEVSPGHVITHAEIEGQEKLNNRIR